MTDTAPNQPRGALRRVRERLTSWAALAVITAAIAGAVMLWIAADASQVLRSALPVPAAVVDTHNRAPSHQASRHARFTAGRLRPGARSSAHRAAIGPNRASQPTLVAITPRAPVLQINQASSGPTSVAAAPQPAAPQPAAPQSPSQPPPASNPPPSSTPPLTSSSSSSSGGDTSASSPDSSGSSSSNHDSSTSTSGGGN